LSPSDKIRVEQGDLTAEKVDAIVNAANTNLSLTNAIAGAIHLKGGATIQEECDNHGSAELGQAVLTGAGNLPAKHVIHAVANYIGESPTPESIRSAIGNAMQVAEDNNIKSISIPSIGSEIGVLPANEVAEVMVGEVSGFLNKSDNIESVKFILLDSRTHDAFSEAVSKIS
jgi:O-acetyl-ADP-ribose deacetylase (regulator of RNase III)